jgi:SPP1 family predicted phage head-tail adaptor
MRAGLLRFPITIMQLSRTKGAFGDDINEWSLFCTTKANVTYRSGNKGETDNQIINSQVVDFTIRHNIQVLEKMRIIYEDRLYKILFISKNIITNSQIITCDYLEKA